MRSLIITRADPGITTRVFSVFRCTKIPGLQGRILAADANVQCGQGEHVAFVGLGAVFMCLYVVGTPVAMFVILWRNRAALHNPAHPDHEDVKLELGSLYQQYEPAFWFFDCFILLHKM